MSFSKMVDFNPEENMRSLDDQTKQLIKEAVRKTYSKFMPNSKSLEYLFEKFKELIEPNFEVSLPSEVKELVEVLSDTLFSYVDKAENGRHAATILLHAGLIDERAVRNLAIVRDYYIMRNMPLNKMRDIYYNLSVKYDVSVVLIQKIILDKK